MRGAVALHSSRTMSRPYYEWAVEQIKKAAPTAKIPPYEKMIRGAIMGVIDIAGCETKTKSRWHMRKHYGFVISNPRILPQPIPCDGWLNFWEVPVAIGRRVSHQIR